MQDIRERFQNLHEIVIAARAKLDRNVWDYLVGGTETETTVRRNRMALELHSLPTARSAQRRVGRLPRQLS